MTEDEPAGQKLDKMPQLDMRLICGFEDINKDKPAGQLFDKMPQ